MRLVSIIVPAYKCADFIEKTINMLLEQTYPYKEIIVVNDGSPDNLGDILEKYRDRIRIITKENGGASSARNRGLDEARGDYIAFIDCDDRIEKDTIERAVNLMEAYDADILRYNIVHEYKDGSQINYIKISDKRLVINKDEYKEKVYIPMMEGIKFNLSMGIYKRNVIGGIRFREDMVTCEDATFNLYVFTRSNRMVFDPDIKYYYYRSGSGLTGSSISIRQKYICNYRYGIYMSQLLSQWGMDNIHYRIKIMMRLFRITIDKLKRDKLMRKRS